MFLVKSRLQLFLVVILSFIFIVGCTYDSEEKALSEKNQSSNIEENTSDENNSDKPNSEIFTNLPKLPTNLEEMLAYPTGEFAGEKYQVNAAEIEKVLEQFPKTGEQAEQEILSSYWKKLVTLFAEDYPDPQNVIDKWETLSFGGLNAKNPKLQFKENYNVEIILDSSGSMAAKIGDKSRMELAKESILDFVESLPEEANVGLRVYGFKGSNAESDKKLSCGSNELVYELKPYEAQGFKKALDKFSPTGWTPLAEAIKFAQKDLSGFNGENNTNIIYIVSDGIETCGGNPVKAAKNLGNSDIKPIVNVIGFDVDNAGQEQLKAVAEASDGKYSYVEDQEQLQNEFHRAAEMASAWRLWKANSMNDVRMENVDRANSIRDNRAVWSDKYNLERHNYGKAIDYLKKKDLISLETSGALYDLRGERLETISTLQGQVFDYLFKVKDKQIDEIEQQIDSLYEGNVE